MTNHISKSQFKAKALELFRRVETTGVPLVITDNGQPKLEIRRYQPRNQNPLDTLRGTVLYYHRPTDPVGAEDWDAAN
jgi:antitoxin (DNA-binding transcriptional repressor) of toxin-antitoxin stability system